MSIHMSVNKAVEMASKEVTPVVKGPHISGYSYLEFIAGRTGDQWRQHTHDSYAVLRTARSKAVARHALALLLRDELEAAHWQASDEYLGPGGARGRCAYALAIVR